MFLSGSGIDSHSKKPSPDPTTPARLDVSVLQDLVLEPMLGIADPRTDDGILCWRYSWLEELDMLRPLVVSLSRLSHELQKILWISPTQVR